MSGSVEDDCSGVAGDAAAHHQLQFQASHYDLDFNIVWPFNKGIGQKVQAVAVMAMVVMVRPLEIWYGNLWTIT
jgi:hypothetical protein